MSTQRQLGIYRSCTPVFDTLYDDSDDRTLVETLVEALATVEGVDAIELSPLYDSIDLDALTRLVEHHENVDGSDALLSFTVDDWNVFISGNGRIRICDGTRQTEPEPVFAATDHVDVADYR